ncbi:MAG: chemotaxis protein CheX [Leptospiraceae bacterium]|nr:chemotaxis protein CheX [Leptospiraceae bacterium]
MDPLLDEKLVLTCARVCSDYFKQTLFVSAEKEAYGPSRNEGLCYESVAQIEMQGSFKGQIFLAMDGYTKMKLLPRIAERYQIDPAMRGMSRSVLLEFTNQMAALIVEELQDGGYELEITPPNDLSNKLVPIDLNVYRQYIMIFFLRDRRLKRYLGRLYLILLMQKFEPRRSARPDHDNQGLADPDLDSK